MMTWEVGQIIFDIKFDLAHVEAIVDKRKSTVSGQVKCIVIPLLIDVLNMEGSDPSRL